MLRSALKALMLLSLFLSIDVTASSQLVSAPKNTPAEWSKPFRPFRIAGNLYYVGTYDLCCYLITTSKGNILINTGLAASAPQIKANIESLGFHFGDTKILLTTQAHFDHMGAMATIKKQTGAKMMVDEKDKDVVIDGGRSDYALGRDTSSYEPVSIDHLLHNGDTVKLGKMNIVMLHHPGHTKGSCSFLFDITDEHKTYKVLIANLPTIVTDKSFGDIPAYPDIAKEYDYTIGAMKKLSFDIWLSSHASQFDLYEKHKPGSSYNPEAFVDRKRYDDAINDLEKEYKKRLEAGK